MAPSHEVSTDTLQQALVASLMRVLAQPDDPEAAREADTAVRALDTRLAPGPERQR